MNRKVLLLSILWLNLATSQIFQSEIDEKLSTACEGRIYAENRIAKVLSDYAKRIEDCGKSLNSSNAPKDVLTSLDTLRTLIVQFASIKNFSPYKNISTCSDINYKITMMDFEQRKFACIQKQLTSNLTLAYRQHADLTVNYQRNINAVGVRSSGLAKILSELPSVFTCYSDYARILAVDQVNIAYYGAVLSAFKKNYCPCLNGESLKRNNSTLDFNIQVYENKLMKSQSKLLNATSNALSKVTQAMNLISSTTLQSLHSTLKNILTTSEFTKITLSNIQNCDDLYGRAKFVKLKLLQYVQALSQARVNQTYCRVYQQNVETLILTEKSGEKVKALHSALNCLKVVVNSYTKYISLLRDSIVKVNKMVYEFEGQSDSYCSCGDEDEGSKTTSSASKSTMTTKIPSRSTSSSSTSSLKTSTTKSTTSSTLKPTTTSTSTTSSTILPTTLTSSTILTTTTSSTKPLTTSTTSSTTSTTSTSTLKPTMTTIPITLTTTSSTLPLTNSTTSSTTSTTSTTTLKPTTTTIPTTLTTTSTTSSTTSTSTLKPTTTTSSTTLQPSTTTLAPCGTLLDFSKNDPSNPATLGFYSGVYKDLSSVYPGYGNISNSRRSARITQKAPAGAYGATGTSELYDGANAKYFAAHPNLKWITTTMADIKTVSGKFLLTLWDGDNQGHFVTRINLTSYQQIGGIWVNAAGNIDTAAFYYDGSTVKYTSGTVEVLACQSTTFTTSTTLMTTSSTTTLTPPCGTAVDFSTNDPSNPATLGFYSGNYKDSSDVYPGYGIAPNTARRTARITLQSPAGAYMAQDKTAYYDGANAKYYLNHPDLKWITTTPADATNVAGKVRVTLWDANSEGHFVTRHNVSNFQTIGCIWVGANDNIDTAAFYYDGVTNKETTGTFEVLACQKTVLPCGTAVDFSTNDPSDSATLGFYSGVYQDSSDVYPGYGIAPNTARRTARITLEPPAGAYMAQDKTAYYDGVTAKYYLAHPDLKWITTNPTNIKNVAGKIKVTAWDGDEQGHFVTRHNISNFQTIGCNYVSAADVINSVAFYYDGVTTQRTNGTFEVLACQPTIIQPCGTLLDFSTNDPSNAATLGFYSGVYQDGSAAYPGFAVYDTARKPARITQKSPAGAYAAVSSKEYYDSQTAGYFAAHPNMKWVTTSMSNIKNVTGKVFLILWDGFPQGHLVVRANLTNYQQIGGIWVDANGNIDSYAYYYDGSSVQFTPGTIEVLVCQ